MNDNKNSKVTFKDSFRKIQQSKIVLNYSTSKIFPLLCPVEEYKWKVINTAYSKNSIEQVKNLKNESFIAFIEERRKEMDYYLQTGKMIQ